MTEYYLTQCPQDAPCERYKCENKAKWLVDGEIGLCEFHWDTIEAYNEREAEKEFDNYCFQALKESGWK